MDAARTDVLIHGAGPVGCALALALRDSGLRTAILEPSPSRFTFRPIALSYASRLILERVGVWERLETTPIETVLVSQQGAFGRARLEAKDAGVPALGYVVDYAALAAALRSQLEKIREKNRIVVTNEAIAALCRPPRIDRRMPCLEVYAWRLPFLPKE